MREVKETGCEFSKRFGLGSSWITTTRHGVGLNMFRFLIVTYLRHVYKMQSFKMDHILNRSYKLLLGWTKIK